MSTAVVDPNIIDRPSAGSVLSSAITLIAISMIVVPMRFWARRQRDNALEVDDWLTIPPLVFNIILGSMTIWCFATPEPPDGTNPLDFIDYRIQTGKKVTYVLEFTQAISLACTKASVLFFYRRIFYVGFKDAFYWTNMILIGIVAAWGTAFCFGFIFTCGTHFTALWTDIRTINTYCKAFLPIEIAFGITDVLMDVIIFLLPFFKVWSLRMTNVKKAATTAMFLLGAFTIAASIVRTYVLLNAVVTVKKQYQQTKTGANNGTVAAATVWGCIESAATLATACLLVVYAPVRDRLKRIGRKAPSPEYTFTRKTESAKSKSRRMWPISLLSTRDMRTDVDGSVFDHGVGGSSSDYINRHNNNYYTTTAMDGDSVPMAITGIVSDGRQDSESTAAPGQHHHGHYSSNDGAAGGKGGAESDADSCFEPGPGGIKVLHTIEQKSQRV